ncbi:MAG TPA: flagellar protein [bacterium]|nr:flagellar protein [bacterium]
MVNNINNSQIQKLSQLQEAQKRQQSIAARPGTPSFSEVLENRVAQSEVPGIKFSSHAEKRLQSRDIDFTQDHMKRLGNAFEKARSKGANETLMVFENFSLIVSVKNSTVITAMDNSAMKENVFTNIDSAVFA